MAVVVEERGRGMDGIIGNGKGVSALRVLVVWVTVSDMRMIIGIERVLGNNTGKDMYE